MKDLQLSGLSVQRVMHGQKELPLPVFYETCSKISDHLTLVSFSVITKSCKFRSASRQRVSPTTQAVSGS